MRVLIGMPPPIVVDFIRSQAGGGGSADPVDNSEWGQVVAALESCSPSDFSNLAYTGSNPTLTALAVGSASDVPYKSSEAGATIDMPWKVLGFNASIPRYVKYRKAVGSGWKHLYASSLAGELLAPIGVGTATFTKDASGNMVASDEAITSVSGSFSYGNKAPYTVPTSITTSDGTYDFCGYNITLNTECLLPFWECNNPNVVYHNLYFNYQEYRNIWSKSPLRSWMNGSASSIPGYWNDENWSGNEFSTSESLITKLGVGSSGFLANVQEAVNRTWVYPDFRSLEGVTLDSNSCEHVSDKFWLLGVGNIWQEGAGDNYNSGNMPDGDAPYDTSYFSIFSNNNSRIKYFMNLDSSVGSSADFWWLRSAYSGNSGGVGLVDGGGSVGDGGVYNVYGVSPACLIG